MTTRAQAIRTMRWGDNEVTNRAGLETIPVNRHTDDRKFLQVIAMSQACFGWQAMNALCSFLFKISPKN